MINDVKSFTKDKLPLNYGRKKIILDYDEVTPDNVVEVLQKALPWHSRNVRDCEYLIGYFLGDQDILRRGAPATSNINNQVVVNNAFPITREVIGYTYGNPTEYVQTDVGKRTDVETLSDIIKKAGGTLKDTISQIYSSICGLSYQITLPSEDISVDYVPRTPIKIDALHPVNTFVVFSNDTGNPQIMSCNIIHTDNDGDIYNCYTNDYIMTISNNMADVEVETNPVGLDPIVMYENAIFLTGDWEQAISVMNAENQIASDSLNDIESTIRSLLVLLNTEFEDENTKLADIKSKRLLTLVGPQGQSVDAKFISPQIDSSSIENIRDYLERARNIITGIPDRQTASGGDTGTAVLNRNGWTDIEIVARLKEMFYKDAKRKQLDIIIRILQLVGLVSTDMDSGNIDITIGRHTTDNLQTKTQAFSTLVATGELATIDCLEISGLTNRVNEVVERGEKAKEENEEKAMVNNLANKAIDFTPQNTKKVDEGNNSDEE